METATYSATAIQIQTPEARLFGVLRGPENAKKIVVFVPANTGTRIGPQRIFTEMAHDLATNGVASLCVDIPGNSDATDAQPPLANHWRETNIIQYRKYLDLVKEYLEANFRFGELILASISVGGHAIVEYGRLRKISRMVLLSPLHYGQEEAVVNTKNLQAYYHKLFRPETWQKLIRFELNWGRIYRNTFRLQAKKQHVKQMEEVVAAPASFDQLRLFCVFGERDADFADVLAYWKSFHEKGECKTLDCEIVEGADHSFFGYKFKQEVIRMVTKWVMEK